MPYIAMNNFQVAPDQAQAFEERWSKRRTYLQDVPGFTGFQLLRGEERDGSIHYASHSTWASHEAFIAWTKSDSFVQAHRGEPLPKGMVQGPPHLECFDVVEMY